MLSLVDAPTDADPERRLTVAAYVCELMEATGRQASLCAPEAGVGRRTVEMWLREGQDAEERAHKGWHLTPNELRRLEFLRTTRRAHARWTARNLEALEKVARGGLVVGKVVEKVDPTRRADGSPMPEGAPAGTRPFVLERKVEQATKLPDPRALEWLLERQAVDEDGERFLAPRVEVTGKDGEPLGGGEARDDRVRRLLAEAEAMAAGAAALGQVRAAEAAP